MNDTKLERVWIDDLVNEFNADHPIAKALVRGIVIDVTSVDEWGARLVIDDGSGAIEASIPLETVEALLEKKGDNGDSVVGKEPDQIRDALADALVATPVEVSGPLHHGTVLMRVDTLLVLKVGA